MKIRSAWKRIAWIAASMLGAVLGLALIVGLREARADPIVRRARIALSGWPAGARPLRVALVSDIHLGNRAMDAERLDRVIAQVNRARPDLVLLAGDFVVGHSPAGASDRAAGLTLPMARLKAPLGIVAVLGNHDHWTAPEAVRSALRKAGVTILENEAVRRGPLVLVGIGDAFSGHDRIARALSAAHAWNGPRVVLTHSPDVAPRLPPGWPLVLAGHTHCGQIVLPFLGALASRSPRADWKRLYDPRYRCGPVRDPGRLVIVTGGVGSGTIPIRLGAPPDWWLLELGP
ncbi:MAG: metallophosphoesterase [Allosphingosinicella sp.]